VTADWSSEERNTQLKGKQAGWISGLFSYSPFPHPACLPFSCEPYGATPQKMIFFIVIAAKTSNLTSKQEIVIEWNTSGTGLG
jgi:hypothetical protein